VTDSVPVSRAPLAGRTVALCVTGSIAAYKAVEVARLLLRAGARVLPVMTASAARFVGPVTLAGICGEAAATDMWDPSFAGELHIKLAERADLVAIVPATADVLARLAQQIEHAAVYFHDPGGLGVEDEDAVVRRLEQPPIPNLRLAQGRVHPLAFGDVACHLGRADDVPRSVLHG